MPLYPRINIRLLLLSASVKPLFDTKAVKYFPYLLKTQHFILPCPSTKSIPHDILSNRRSHSILVSGVQCINFLPRILMSRSPKLKMNTYLVGIQLPVLSPSGPIARDWRLSGGVRVNMSSPQGYVFAPGFLQPR